MNNYSRMKSHISLQRENVESSVAVSFPTRRVSQERTDKATKINPTKTPKKQKVCPMCGARKRNSHYLLIGQRCFGREEIKVCIEKKTFVAKA